MLESAGEGARLSALRSEFVDDCLDRLRRGCPGVSDWEERKLCAESALGGVWPVTLASVRVRS